MQSIITKTHKMVLGGLVLGFVANPVFADKIIYSSKAKKGEKHHHHASEWVTSSSGGLAIVNKNNADYWFKLSGVMRLDEILYMGSAKDKQGQFSSGGNVRVLEMYLDGGVGKNWEYTWTLSYDGKNVSIGDTWISYIGLLTERNQIFVGRVSGNWFGLDNANSTSWNPFLERSMQSAAFYPGDGLGVVTDVWWDMGAVTLMAAQPKVKDNDGAILASQGLRDRWRATIRGTIAPVHECGNVWHMGVSGAWRELPSNRGVNVQFKTGPSVKSRNTPEILDTGGIAANSVREFNVELARQYGPFMLEGEYTTVGVHRVNTQLGSVRFDGWNVQTRYMLTGESHDYDVRDGNFGSVKPTGSLGAFEIAARYDSVNLNNKDVQGGSGRNMTLGLNWFYNQNVRFSANYIHAIMKKPNILTNKRIVDIFGIRAQVRFK